MGGSPLSGRPSIRLPWSPSPHVGQNYSNKHINYRCTTAAFTLAPAPGGFRHSVLTRPETAPSRRLLFVGSHLCAPASFRQHLAELPLPSATGYSRPQNGHYRYSHRGLPPHQFIAMSGVHMAVKHYGA
jgi:hypothetical protein